MDEQKAVGVGAVGILSFIFALGLIVVFATMGYGQGNMSGGGEITSGGSGSCDIQFPANAGDDDSIGAAIDSWISEHNPTSPLKNKGRLFAQSGRGSNVNPALMVAIARKESSLGKAVPDTSYNPFGRTATDSQPGVVVEGRRWYKFNSWDEAIAEEGPYIKRVYLDEGITTMEAFVNKYAPPSENDTAGYIKEMNDYINEMSQMANGALGEGCVQLAEGETGPQTCGVGYTAPAATCGWIQIPSQDYYTKYGDADEDWGKPSLVNMVMGVAKSWREAGKTMMQVGEGSAQCGHATGHESHDRGTDVDIDIPGGMMVDGANYHPDLAIAAAEKFIACGATDIGYQDPQVINTVNAWAQENNLAGRVRNWSGHKNHFHVRSEKR